jgi:hypothetical protein
VCFRTQHFSRKCVAFLLDHTVYRVERESATTTISVLFEHLLCIIRVFIDSDGDALAAYYSQQNAFGGDNQLTHENSLFLLLILIYRYIYYF